MDNPVAVVFICSLNLFDLSFGLFQFLAQLMQLLRVSCRLLDAAVCNQCFGGLIVFNSQLRKSHFDGLVLLLEVFRAALVGL